MTIGKRNTAVKITAERKLGFHRDHGVGATVGLYLQVAESPKRDVTRSWAFRYVSPITGKRRWMGLGPADVIGLAEARDLARTARRLVKLGADPIEHRREKVAAERDAYLREQASKMTFEACVEGYLATRLDKFRNAKHKWQWQETLRRACQKFGQINVAEIDTPMITKFLQPLWRETPETAGRIRGRIEKVLDWAKVHQFRDGENPARWKGHLENVFAAAENGNHFPAMPFEQVPEFMLQLRERDSISARALEFLILAAARPGEIRGMTWAELDLNKAQWTIPGARMKAEQEHIVALSKRAVALLKALPPVGAYVFPGQSKPWLSDGAMNALLKKMHKARVASGRAPWVDKESGKLVVPHGFRSSFRDWAGEITNFDREVIEHALAHKLPDRVEASYRRRTALQKRALLMAAWANYCDSVPAESALVIPIRT